MFDLQKVLTTLQGDVGSFYYKRKFVTCNFTVYDIGKSKHIAICGASLMEKGVLLKLVHAYAKVLHFHFSSSFLSVYHMRVYYSDIDKMKKYTMPPLLAFSIDLASFFYFDRTYRHNSYFDCNLLMH